MESKIQSVVLQFFVIMLTDHEAIVKL